MYDFYSEENFTFIGKDKMFPRHINKETTLTKQPVSH